MNRKNRNCRQSFFRGTDLGTQNVADDDDAFPFPPSMCSLGANAGRIHQHTTTTTSAVIEIRDPWETGRTYLVSSAIHGTWGSWEVWPPFRVRPESLCRPNFA